MREERYGRVSMVHTQRSRADLDYLVGQTGKTRSAVIAAALSLYAAALEHQRVGGGVYLRRKAGAELEKARLM